MLLKFAYLGAWHSHAVMHVREAVQRPEEFQLVGLFEPQQDVLAQKLSQWAEYMPDIPVFDSVSDVLSSTAEAVIIEGRIQQNLDYAEQALEAGKHVLLEKPAGVDLAHLERVHQLANSKGLHLQMAYMWRYNPALYEMIRLVKTGVLGDIFYYRGHIPKSKSYHPQIARDLGVYKTAIYFEMAGHLVDLMVTLMGEPPRVQSILGQHYGDRKHVDNAVVLHEFTNGIGTIETSAMHIESGRTRRIEVYGTGGTAIHTPIGSPNLSLCLEEAGEGYPAGWQDLVFPTTEDSPSLLRELAACIRGDKAPDYTLAHDMAVQRTLFTGCAIPDGHALIGFRKLTT